MPQAQLPAQPAEAPDWVQEETDYRQILLREGVVVIPTPLINDLNGQSALRTQLQQAYVQHYRESPEFANPNPTDPRWQPQLGGFAASANPSSFHHVFARQMREMCTSVVLDADVLPIDGRKLEKPFDRVMWRIAGERPTAESMHRDESQTALDGDVIFGGWINLEDVPQNFSCCPQTHQEVGGQNRGFAKLGAEEQVRYRPHFSLVSIPPGCMVIFYERLVHEVVSILVPPGRTMIRMFLGWRVTDAEEPLFGTQRTLAWVEDQGVPKIKSGQDPPVWPSAYSNFPRNFQKLTDWSQRTFVPQCLYTHTVAGSGAAAGTTWIRVKAKMRSLREYGLPLHRQYDVHETRLLAPQREWMLYTFDSPATRIKYTAVAPDEWAAYLAAQHAVPLGSVVRRPRPSRDME